MHKILGLDLGTNSIGWAMINDNEIESSGVKIILNSSLDEKRNLSNQVRLTSLLTFVKNNIKTITLTLITVTMFLLSFLSPIDWQFWANLGIGSLIASLTFSKK